MASNPKTGFLELPAEIRNEIYAHLTEDIDTNVGPKTVRLRPRIDFPKHWSKRNPHRGDVYSLNQVCRTTRHEFGPLYASQISHRVRIDEGLLHWFLQDFLLVEHAFALKPKRIEIELAYPVGERLHRPDFLPLLTLCLANEELHCTFLNKFGPIPEIDNVFWNHAVAWGEAILNDLLEILLYTLDGTTTAIDLVFRDDCGRDFITDIPGPGRCPNRAPPSMNDYITELGVGTWDARVHFVVSKRDAKKQGSRLRRKAFETQYRLIEN